MDSATSKTPIFVAELSCSHKGSFDRALETIRQVRSDYIKFQLWTEPMAVDHIIQKGAWARHSLTHLYDIARTPAEWLPDLFSAAKDAKLRPLATPFDLPAVDFLERLDCEAYKIASFEIVDLKLIDFAASTKKPIILSTGQAALNEIRAAVWTAKKHTDDITLLHCVSEYPTRIEDANLATMNGLRQHFPFCKVGLSDHSKGSTVPVAATVLGAEMIEKHVDLDLTSLDRYFAMLPDEFNQMVKDCRLAKSAVGIIKYSEGGELRRSLYWAESLEAGTVVEDHHLKTARPNRGLNPIKKEKILGQILTKDVKRDEPVRR